MHDLQDVIAAPAAPKTCQRLYIKAKVCLHHHGAVLVPHAMQARLPVPSSITGSWARKRDFDMHCQEHTYLTSTCQRSVRLCVHNSIQRTAAVHVKGNHARVVPHRSPALQLLLPLRNACCTPSSSRTATGVAAALAPPSGTRPQLGETCLPAASCQLQPPGQAPAPRPRPRLRPAPTARPRTHPPEPAWPCRHLRLHRPQHLGPAGRRWPQRWLPRPRRCRWPLGWPTPQSRLRLATTSARCTWSCRQAA